MEDLLKNLMSITGMYMSTRKKMLSNSKIQVLDLIFLGVMLHNTYTYKECLHAKVIIALLKEYVMLSPSF